MVAGSPDPTCAPGVVLPFGNLSFECVDRFKYLGVLFDRKASYKTMLKGILEKSRKSMYWMVRFIANHQWTMPHTRLVLMDVFVRSVMQFACPVWSPALLNPNCLIEHV
jgi:hypothetical protein